MKRLALALLATTVLAACGESVSPTAPSLRAPTFKLGTGNGITEFGTTISGVSNVTQVSALGINLTGLVVGYTQSDVTVGTTTTTSYNAFARTATGTITKLALGTGWSNGYGFAVNDNGAIVGVAYNSSNVPRAVSWASTAATATDLGGLVAGGASYAMAIDPSGRAAGFALSSNGFPHAALFSGGSVTDLGQLSGGWMSFANDLATVGGTVTVVGSAMNSSWVRRAFKWTAATGMVELTTPTTVDNGTVREATATGINTAGDIVGFVTLADNTTRAMIWPGATGTPTFLVGLANNVANVAMDINNAGYIVGYSQAQNGSTYRNCWWVAPTGGVYSKASQLGEPSGFSASYGQSISNGLLSPGTGQQPLRVAGILVTTATSQLRAANWE